MPACMAPSIDAHEVEPARERHPRPVSRSSSRLARSGARSKTVMIRGSSADLMMQPARHTPATSRRLMSKPQGRRCRLQKREALHVGQHDAGEERLAHVSPAARAAAGVYGPAWTSPAATAQRPSPPSGPTGSACPRRCRCSAPARAARARSATPTCPCPAVPASARIMSMRYPPVSSSRLRKMRAVISSRYELSSPSCQSLVDVGQLVVGETQQLLHDRVGLGDELHHAVFDAVVHHLDEVADRTGPQVGHAGRPVARGRLWLRAPARSAEYACLGPPGMRLGP